MTGLELRSVPPWWPAGLEAPGAGGRDGELRVHVEPGRFGAAMRALHDAGARFVMLTTARDGGLLGVVALRGQLAIVAAAAGADGLVRYDALGSWWPAARWAELELREREPAVQPQGLPSEARLPGSDADRLDRRVDGFDVFALPYGPVRSGVFEAIQFVIETGGEDVPRLQTRPFFKRRGLERRAVGMAPEQAVYVAERVAGIATVAHACAFAHAVERAAGVEPPPRALRWRAVYAELERLANHLDVIAKQAETTALAVGQARFQILKEDVLRLQASLTGSRFARGVIVPGGVRFDGQLAPDALRAWADRFERALRTDRRMFLATASMTDRLIGAGHLHRALVERMAAVGPLARGSGLSTDARHERPYGAYRHLGLRVVTARAGDAMARVEVRFGEIAESLRILRQAADQLARRDGGLRAPLPDDASGAAFGWVEAPQGELLYHVALDAGTVAALHIASPSLRNWALFDHAFPADVLTDFAFIEHSFGLTPAGASR